MTSFDAPRAGMPGQTASGVEIMKQPYDDIGLRSELGASGSIRVSPDIIPYGPATVPDPQRFFSSNWDSDVGVDITAGEPNNIYVRAMNYGTRPAAGKGYLYYCDATLIPWPSLWSGHALWTADKADHVDLEAGADGITVGGVPFTWTPPVVNPRAPYSLVARVATEAHPNPIPPGDGTLADLVGYFAPSANGAAASAIRAAITVGPDEANDLTVGVGLETRGEAIPHLHIAVRCSKIPIGCGLTASARSPGLHPAVDIRGPVTRYPEFVLGAETSLKAESSAPVTLGFRANGQTIPQDAWIDLLAMVPADAPAPGRRVVIGSFTLLFR